MRRGTDIRGHRGSADEARRSGRSYLLDHQRNDGGWGYGVWNEQSFAEPTAWAVIALSEDEGARASQARAVEFLLSRQNDDGGWSNVEGMRSDIMTARVVLALGPLAGCNDAARAGGNWLQANERPAEGGWGWCYGTTGFIDTASFAIMALSAVGMLDEYGRLFRYVRQLQCIDGGWCSHVPSKMSVVQESQISVTPLGVLALTTLGSDVHSDEGLRRAVDRMEQWIRNDAVTTPYSLALALWCLAEAGGSEWAVSTVLERVIDLIVGGGMSIWHMALAVHALGQVGR